MAKPTAIPRRLDLSRTPTRLWAYFSLVAASILVAWLAFSNGIGYARSRVQTITKDSVPSVVAAQEIRKGLFKMDGDTVANYLRTRQGAKAAYDIDADRAAIAKQLVLAARNITYGEAESVPIESIVGGLPKYAGLASAASQGGEAKPLLAASELLHQELVKSANDLDKVNRDQLTAAFEDSRTGLRFRTAVALVLGLGFLGVLVFVQLQIARLSRRSVNVPLACATLIALAVVVSNVRLMVVETETIRAAKLDAFDSVGYLAEAQAATADARAQALFGLIPEAQEKAWLRCRQQLDALAATDRTEELNRAYTATDKPAFKGLLGNELRNITFEGEIEAALAELQAFERFKTTLQGLQSKEEASTPDEAFALAFHSPGSVDDAYREADRTIEATKAINVAHFGMSRDEAFAQLAFPSLSLNLLSLAMIVLAYFGVRQRAGEYA